MNNRPGRFTAPLGKGASPTQWDSGKKHLGGWLSLSPHSKKKVEVHRREVNTNFIMCSGP